MLNIIYLSEQKTREFYKVSDIDTLQTFSRWQVGTKLFIPEFDTSKQYLWTLEEGKDVGAIIGVIDLTDVNAPKAAKLFISQLCAKGADRTPIFENNAVAKFVSTHTTPEILKRYGGKILEITKTESVAKLEYDTDERKYLELEEKRTVFCWNQDVKTKFTNDKAAKLLESETEKPNPFGMYIDKEPDEAE